MPELRTAPPCSHQLHACPSHEDTAALVLAVYLGAAGYLFGLMAIVLGSSLVETIALAVLSLVAGGVALAALRCWKALARDTDRGATFFEWLTGGVIATVAVGGVLVAWTLFRIAALGGPFPAHSVPASGLEVFCRVLLATMSTAFLGASVLLLVSMLRSVAARKPAS